MGSLVSSDPGARTRTRAKQMTKFISSSFGADRRLASGGMKESLSLAPFKRKQLRRERYPSQAHPPLGTGFLPLSRTAAFLFGVEAHLFTAPLGPPRLPPYQLFPLLSPSPLYLHSSSATLALPADLYAPRRAGARTNIHPQGTVGNVAF